MNSWRTSVVAVAQLNLLHVDAKLLDRLPLHRALADIDVAVVPARRQRNAAEHGASAQSTVNAHSLPLVKPHLELHALEVHRARSRGVQPAHTGAICAQCAGSETAQHRSPVS